MKIQINRISYYAYYAYVASFYTALISCAIWLLYNIGVGLLPLLAYIWHMLWHMPALAIGLLCLLYLILSNPQADKKNPTDRL